MWAGVIVEVGSSAGVRGAGEITAVVLVVVAAAAAALSQSLPSLCCDIHVKTSHKM